MKAIYKTLLISSVLVLVCCFFSCRNNGNNAVPQKMLIVGKWNLQQQHVQLLIDGVKTIDTVYTADAVTNTYAYAVFNSDGTDSTRSVYNPGSLSLTEVPYFASSKGTYSISNSIFNNSFGVSGWFSYAVGSTGAPVQETISYKIILLNTSHLNLLEQLAFTATNTGTHTYRITNYYYYTK